jgi:hypothetical protein
MLVSLRSQLRRHRRSALAVLAILLVATVALTAHAAMMSSTHGNNGMGAMTAICLIAASLAAVVVVGGLAVRRRFSRSSWLIPPPVVPDFAFIAAFSGLFARAGPPPLLQVFRL